MRTEEAIFSGYETGFDGKVKISSVMRHMQQTAENDLASMGLSYDVLRERGCFFAVARMEMRFNFLPEKNHTYQLRTVPVKLKGSSFIRDFALFDGNDTVMLASSIWALIDYEKRAILRPSALGGEIPGHPEFASGFEPGRIASHDAAEAESTVKASRRVYRSMLDSNRHLNNCVYADIITDHITKTYASPKILISFSGEALEDDELDLTVSSYGGYETISADNTTRSRKCFDAQISEMTAE